MELFHRSPSAFDVALLGPKILCVAPCLPMQTANFRPGHNAVMLGVEQVISIWFLPFFVRRRKSLRMRMRTENIMLRPCPFFHPIMARSQVETGSIWAETAETGAETAVLRTPKWSKRSPQTSETPGFWALPSRRRFLRPS